MWHKNAGTSCFRFVTSTHLTDGRTERPWQYRALHYVQSHGDNITSAAFVLTIMLNTSDCDLLNRI